MTSAPVSRLEGEAAVVPSVVSPSPPHVTALRARGQEDVVLPRHTGGVHGLLRRARVQEG